MIESTERSDGTLDAVAAWMEGLLGERKTYYISSPVTKRNVYLRRIQPRGFIINGLIWTPVRISNVRVQVDFIITTEIKLNGGFAFWRI